VYKGEGVNESV